MSEYENRPKPFSKERTKATLCKLIFFYSIFYIVMKLMAVFNGFPATPNVLMSIPFVIFAVLGWLMTRSQNFSWLYVIVGIIVISAVRYYEIEWLKYLSGYFA